MKRRPYSLVIIARNAAALLPNASPSVPAPDEYWLSIPAAGDDTVAVAEHLGARVICQELAGLRARRSASPRCRHNMTGCCRWMRTSA